MPRPKSVTDEEVAQLLSGYKGNDVTYPATLRTLYSVRNAVYKFNRENDRKFRCIIRDDGVVLTERPMKTAHDAAAKEIAAVLSEAKREGEGDTDVLLDRIKDVLERVFEDADEEEEQPRKRKRA